MCVVLPSDVMEVVLREACSSCDESHRGVFNDLLPHGELYIKYTGIIDAFMYTTMIAVHTALIVDTLIL